jgi:bacteriocin-like protein
MRSDDRLKTRRLLMEREPKSVNAKPEADPKSAELKKTELSEEQLAAISGGRRHVIPPPPMEQGGGHK